MKYAIHDVIEYYYNTGKQNFELVVDLCDPTEYPRYANDKWDFLKVQKLERQGDEPADESELGSFTALVELEYTPYNHIRQIWRLE